MEYQIKDYTDNRLVKFYTYLKTLEDEMELKGKEDNYSEVVFPEDYLPEISSIFYNKETEETLLSQDENQPTEVLLSYYVKLIKELYDYKEDKEEIEKRFNFLDLRGYKSVFIYNRLSSAINGLYAINYRDKFEDEFAFRDEIKNNINKYIDPIILTLFTFENLEIISYVLSFIYDTKANKNCYEESFKYSFKLKYMLFRRVIKDLINLNFVVINREVLKKKLSTTT
jgi:hypothetical protein